MAKQKQLPPQIVVRDGDQTIRKQLNKIEHEWNRREGSVAVWDYSRIIRALVSREAQKIEIEQRQQ